jgi:hypothetical protein
MGSIRLGSLFLTLPMRGLIGQLIISSEDEGRGPASPSDHGRSPAVENRLRRILTRVLDENEFLSPHGIRSLSRYHAEHPYVFAAGGQEYRVGYLPAESDTGLATRTGAGPSGCWSTR